MWPWAWSARTFAHKCAGCNHTKKSYLCSSTPREWAVRIWKYLHTVVSARDHNKTEFLCADWSWRTNFLARKSTVSAPLPDEQWYVFFLIKSLNAATFKFLGYPFFFSPVTLKFSYFVCFKANLNCYLLYLPDSHLSPALRYLNLFSAASPTFIFLVIPGPIYHTTREHWILRFFLQPTRKKKSNNR